MKVYRRSHKAHELHQKKIMSKHDWNFFTADASKTYFVMGNLYIWILSFVGIFSTNRHPGPEPVRKSSAGFHRASCLNGTENADQIQKSKSCYSHAAILVVDMCTLWLWDVPLHLSAREGQCSLYSISSPANHWCKEMQEEHCGFGAPWTATQRDQE